MKRKQIWETALEHWPAKILSLAAAAILFVFYRINTLEERFFSVPLKVSPPAGLAIANPYPRSVRVTLRGQGDGIFSILEEDINVSADIHSFTTEGELRVPLRVVRKGSALNVEPLDIRAEPSEVKFTLEREQVKTVEVAPAVTGLPAHGYELVQYSVTPNTVEVSGPRSLIHGMEKVMTEDIDVSGSAEDFTLEVQLVKENALVRYPREASVIFRGIVRAAEIIKTFEELDIITIDLPPDLQIAQPLPKGSIRLQGNQLAIESITPEQVRLVIDCGEVRRPGSLKMYPKPDIPPELVVLKYEPQELTVTFRAKAKEGGQQ